LGNAEHTRRGEHRPESNAPFTGDRQPACQRQSRPAVDAPRTIPPLEKGGSREGNEFVRSPRATALLAADYRILLSKDSKVVLAATGALRRSSLRRSATDTRGLLNQGAASIANARVSYVLPEGKYTFTAYVNNVADTIYKNHTLTSLGAAQE